MNKRLTAGTARQPVRGRAGHRLVALCVAFGFVLAACTASGTEDQDAAAGPDTGTPTGPAADAVGEPDGTRTITHFLGQVEIPENPQRVVALQVWGAYAAFDTGFDGLIGSPTNANSLHAVDEYWIGQSVTSARQVLDDIRTHMVDGG